MHCVVHYAMHHVMHYAMHHVMHRVMHYAMHCVMYYAMQAAEYLRLTVEEGEEDLGDGMKGLDDLDDQDLCVWSARFGSSGAAEAPF